MHRFSSRLRMIALIAVVAMVGFLLLAVACSSGDGTGGDGPPGPDGVNGDTDGDVDGNTDGDTDGDVDDEQLVSDVEAATTSLRTWFDELESLVAEQGEETAKATMVETLLADPDVQWAASTSQGVVIEYTSGQRGVLLLDPLRGDPDTEDGFPATQKAAQGSPPSTRATLDVLAANGVGPARSAIYLASAYSDFSHHHDRIVSAANASLAQVGYPQFETHFDEDCTLERYKQLEGYGIIHLCGHGVLFPTQGGGQSDVYLSTGTEVPTTRDGIEAFVIANLAAFQAVPKQIMPVEAGIRTRWGVNAAYVTANLDLHDEGSLVWLGFCYSDVSPWCEPFRQAGAAACLSWDWSLVAAQDSTWARSMYTAMCDTTLAAPVTIKEWYDGVGATYVDPVDQRPVTLQRGGDPDLTLWAVAAGERLVWSADIGSYSSEGSPSVAEGKLYVPAAPAGVEENGGILCFNGSTGEQLWTYQPTETSFAYNPLPVDGTLYVGSPRTCLDWTTGSAIWTAEGWGNSMSAPAAYEGGQLYTVRGWPDEHMRCSQAADGTEVWESQRGYAEGLGAPTIADGRIYLSGDDRVKCVEFEAESVSETWDYLAEGNLTEPSVAGGTVYVGSRAGELIALDAATGVLRWRKVTDEGLVGTLAVAGGNIYACTRGDRLAAFTSDGNLLWETASTVGGWTTSSVSAAPAVTDDYVYVTGGANVECIDTANGQVLWEYTPDPNVSSWSAPVVSDGYVYMMGGGKVYCIRAQEGDAGSWPVYKHNPARTGAR